MKLNVPRLSLPEQSGSSITSDSSATFDDIQVRSTSRNQQNPFRKERKRRAGFSLPPNLIQPPNIVKGMKELDNFGFRTTTSQIDSTAFVFLTDYPKKKLGFHVSDLWSQRQQQEFLKILRLERAQFARERQVAFLNYLIQNRKKMEKPMEADQLYQRIMHDVNPEIAAKYSRGGKHGALFKQITNQAVLREKGTTKVRTPLTLSEPFMKRHIMGHSKSASMNNRLRKLEDLIVNCKATLTNIKKSQHSLAQTTRPSHITDSPDSEIYDDIFASMKITKKQNFPLRIKRKKVI